MLHSVSYLDQVEVRTGRKTGRGRVEGGAVFLNINILFGHLNITDTLLYVDMSILCNNNSYNQYFSENLGVLHVNTQKHKEYFLLDDLALQRMNRNIV